MLWNEKWDKPQADVFSLDSLIAWLEMQPPLEPYDYTCNGTCALALYFRYAGFSDVDVRVSDARLDGRTRPLPSGWNEIAQGSSRDGSPQRLTFGAALGRARKLRTQEKPSQSDDV